MSLNTYEQQLIKAVAGNDIREAKKWAVIALDADKTKKNEPFVNRYKSILTSEGSNMIELPGNLKEIMLCEDVSMSFKENRYYTTERENKIANQIFRMSKVSSKLMEMQIPYKNATLLYGPPGVGKTMFGKYIAYKMGLPFCYLNFSHVVGSYMGVTSQNISRAFTYTSSNPCVFMLDEVDTISLNRESSGGSGAEKEMARITITLMQEFDRLTNDVVIIAATNRLDLLDEAFISRCPIRHNMIPFSVEENRNMVQKFLTDINMSFPAAEIETLVTEEKDQRSVINRLVRKIAEKLEKESGK
jgi:SpoVK/Ycf46/Vps4 family AAA+-type ATPase